MAGICKRGNMWYATWRQDGKAVEKSTKVAVGKTVTEQTKSKNKARAVAQQMEAAAKGCTEYEEAMSSVLSVFRANGFVQPTPTVAELFAEVPETGNPRSCVNRRRAFFKFTEWLGERANRSVREISIEDCRAFVRAKLFEISRGTVEQYRTYLFGAFKYAKVEKQILTHNPWEAVSVVKVMRQAGIEDSRLDRLPFTPEEMQTILFRFPQPYCDLAAVSFYAAGLRMGDCCMLRWADVDFEQNGISVRERKTKRYSFRHLLPELRERLLARKALQGEDEEFVFPELARKYQAGAGAVSTEFTGLLSSFGIVTCPEGDKALTGRRRRVTSKSFHSIRHSVVSFGRSNPNLSPDVVRETVGHQSETVERGYFTAADDAKLAVQRAVADMVKPPDAA